MLSTSQKPCVLKPVLSLYWQASLANGTAPCGAFTVCEKKETVQLSSSGHHEDREKKALEQCLLVFCRHWHLRFLSFFLSSWQSRYTCSSFTLSVSQWASHVPHSNTVRQASTSAFKREHHNWPRFQSVHHLPRLGFFPVMFSFVCTMPWT